MAKKKSAATDDASAASELTNGAEACPDCGNAPHGIEHDPKSFERFEVGCLVCKDHRARGSTQEEATARWNAGEYLPSKG